MCFLAGALMVAIPLSVAAQTPAPPPVFDAVTVKPFVPTGPWHRTPKLDPTRLYLEGSTPLEMIVYAYGIQYNQVDQLPDWAQREYFQVTGVTDKPASQDQMRLMLQRVLAERFQFTFVDTDAPHPVDALVVAPEGLKMKPSTSDADCSSGGVDMDRVKAAHLPPGASVSMAGCTMADLLKNLNLRRRLGSQPPVIDQTGLTGKYSMLLWERMDGCQELASGAGIHCDSVEPVEAAMRREFGLTLVRTTAPYRVLHTTKLEPPAANP